MTRYTPDEFGLPAPESTSPVTTSNDIWALALKAVEGLKSVRHFKRALSTGNDDLDEFVDRGEFEVISGAQAESLNLPMRLQGLFDNILSAANEESQQTFLTKSHRPHLFARSIFSGTASPWESLGFQSIQALRTTDTLDSLQPGKAYFPLSGTVAAGMELPSSGTVNQRGVLMVFSLADGKLPLNLGETDDAILVWVTLSATPGIYTRSKITSSWRDWTRLDAAGGDPSVVSGLTGQVNLWGSSTPAGMHPELSKALNEYGVEVHHHARGGQWASQTAANIGSTAITIPVVGGTIPASGSVDLNTAGSILDGVDLYLSPTNRKLLGWLGGVHGELIGTGDTFTNRGATFTRSNPGVAVTVSSPAWVPDTRTGAHLNIYNSSKNDLTVRRTVEHLEKAKVHLDQAVALWKSRGQDFLILTHFVNTDTPANDDGRSLINAYNSYIRTTYPDNLVDMGLLVTQSKMWQWTGITPTATDTAQQALGNLPPSVAGNGNHFNEAGYRYISQQVVDWLLAQKYIGEGRVPFQELVSSGASLTEDPADPGFYLIGG